MMTTLENFWYGNIQPFDMDIVSGSQYEKVSKRKARREDALLEVLTDKQKVLYNKLSDAQLEQSSLGECDAFRRGFSLGVKMITEVYREE